MKKIVLTSLLFTTFLLTAYAQSVEWVVAPEYSEIIYFGPQMYKVKKGGKVGIIGTDGKVILHPEYDAINLFYEGRAVFVNRSPNGWLIKGVLTDDGSVSFTKGDYYLLPEYMFYSEGLLTVADGYGRYGYLDEKCLPAFEFTSDEVRPFSEGFAAIGNEDTFHWINTYGEQILPRLKNGGTPYGGTNFYNGRAYLWDEDGVFFMLGEDGRTSKIQDQDLVVDYLYRAGTQKGEKVEYTTFEQSFSNLWMPEERNGLWTLMSKTGKLLSPFQYDNVSRFSDGTAVACYEGKYGLLHMVDDNSTFSTHANKSNLIFSAGAACSCEFQLSVPQKWRDQPISVVLKDPDTGNQISIENKGRNNYSFLYQPNPATVQEVKDFRVEVKNNGIQPLLSKEKFQRTSN